MTNPADQSGAHALPEWTSALAVVAHPDDESFGLGAVLETFARNGTSVSVLCLTQGEASTLHGVPGELRSLRAVELQSAAAALGLTAAVLGDHPDGALAGEPRPRLAEEVAKAAADTGAQGLLVFDPSGVSGHPDHSAASQAAMDAAEALGLPVLGWTLPRAVADQLNQELGTGFIGHEPTDIDLAVTVVRDRQRIASLAHASQAVPTSVLWRRLELLGDTEHLRWLRRDQGPQAQPAPPKAPTSPSVQTMRVDHLGEDRFDIAIRGHVLRIDQPTDIGGEDEGPTPTELFVASLASCVAFYARRYLRRHHLEQEGLSVEASYTLTTKPARVEGIEVTITVPDSVPAQRRDGLLAVASHCTVHNSITTAPEITVSLLPPGLET